MEIELPQIFIGERTKRIVAVGRLIPAKNYPLLINAFELFCQKHTSYVLEIYGDGVEKEKIQHLVNKSICKEKIFMQGACQNVLERIRDAELYVLSSDLEGMPNALIEAMALGLACVATDCPSGGPADLIKHKSDGILVPVNNPQVMSEAMSFLVENIEERKEISCNATKIRKRLDIKYIGNEWMRFIIYIAKKEFT